MRALLVVCLASVQLSVIADILPSSRTAPWSSGVTVGVPGGIPTRTNIFVNVLTTTNIKYLCVTNGSRDVGSNIDNAMTDCPSGQVVYLPAGTYTCSNRIIVQYTDNYTLRGDGPGKTILSLQGGDFNMGTEENPVPKGGALVVTGGATKGSTNLIVADNTTVHSNNLITLVMSTPSWMHTLNTTVSTNGDTGTVMTITIKCSGKPNTTNVNMALPLPYDVSGMSPKIIPWGNNGAFNGHLTTGVGFEDLTFDLTNAAAIPVTMAQTWGCWFKNVELTGTPSKELFLLEFCASEIRDSYFHDQQGTGPNHAGVDLRGNCCFNLVENNICFKAGKGGIFLGDAEGDCVANVIAYNFIIRAEFTLGSVFYAGLVDSHGFGDMLNLYEGNYSPGITSDGYYGSSSLGTLLRNYIHADTYELGPYCIDLTHYSDYYNVVGNVLGGTNVSSYMFTNNGGYGNAIYRLGYPNVGNGAYGGGTEGTTIGPTTPPNYATSPNDLTNAQALDLNVTNTIIRHGNYDVVNASVVWMTNDNQGTGVDFTNHVIPKSYYLSGKPTWFSNCVWPPIGSDLSPMTNPIPAQLRYLGIDYSAGSPLISVIPSSLNFGTLLTNTSTSLTFVVSNGGGGTLIGTSTVASPFIITSGSPYSLVSNTVQTITVSYSPTTAGSDSGTVTCTGGGGATVSLSGSATNAPFFGVMTKISGNVTISGATVIK